MLKAIVVVSLGLLVLGLTAPLWIRAVGLGLPSLPPSGTLVAIAGGHRLNVFAEGRGPSVVLVHGLPGSAHDWQPLPELLVAGGFRVIRYDRTGYGHSSARQSDDSHGIAANATELLALIAALDLERPILIGWSYGGGVALRAAAQAPSKVGAVLLVGSDGPTTPAFGWFGSIFMATEAPRRWAIASGIPPRVGIAMMGRQAFQAPVPDWWPAHALAVIAAPQTQRTWAREVRDFDPQMIPSESGGVPVVLMHGTDDRFVPLAVARALHPQLPGSVLLTVDKGGHMLPNTHAQQVVDAVRSLATWRPVAVVPER